MGDRFGFDQVPSFATASDPDQMLADQRKRIGAYADYREKLSGLVGRAETEDRRIGVAFGETRGVHDLRIDPRAMKMASEELAETVERLVNEARQDLRNQTSQLMEDTFGTVNPGSLLPDTTGLTEHLDDVTKAANEATADITALAERLLGSMPGRTEGSGNRQPPKEP